MSESGIDVLIKEVGDRIRELRKERNMTQLDFAIKTNLDVRQVQRLERGHTSATLKTIYKITEGLEIDFPTFFSFSSKQE